MRSDIAKKIISETSKETTEKVKEYTNNLINQPMEAKRYKKDSKEVEAVQWSTSENISKIQEWLGSSLSSEPRDGIGVMGYFLKTENGTEMISWGSYVVKKENGYLKLSIIKYLKESISKLPLNPFNYGSNNSKLQHQGILTK